MKNNSLALAMILSLSSAYADGDGSNEAAEISSVPTQNTSAPASCCDMPISLSPYLPSGGFNTHLDALYWRADEDGLEYGTLMKAPPLIGRPSTTKTKILDMDFKWDPGFRVGVGYLFDCYDFWALNLDWTHIHSHAHAKSFAKGLESQTGEVDTIISPWVNLLFELRHGSTEASAHWRVNYDMFDLDFGRSFFLSNRFVLNPYFGFRGGRINQNYKVRYETAFINSESAPTFFKEVTFQGTNNFGGFGIRAGTELMWRLSEHWHFYSEFSANALYGRFKIHMRNDNDQGLGEGAIPPNTLNYITSENFWRVRLNFEESIGLGWETFFNCACYHMSIRAAYTLSQWLNQNELYYTLYFRGQDTISTLPIRNHGDLNFHGVQLSLRFDF
jgi:hypothetical protein